MRVHSMAVAAGLLGVAACSGGAGAGPPVDPAEYQGGESLHPRLPDGRIVYLGHDTHHPECFAFAAGTGGEKQTEKAECLGGERRLQECPGGELYRSKTQTSCICAEIGGGEVRRVGCPP